MTKKLKLTLEQHRELGIRLHAIRNQIGADACLVGNAYPLCSSRALVTKMLKAQKLLDEVRSKLDDWVFDELELSELGSDQKMSVYYPGGNVGITVVKQ